MSIFKLPDLGEGLPDAEIHQWHIQEGDTVALDQPLVAMETAKAVVDVPSPQAGKIIKLYGKIGDIIATGAPLLEFESTQPAEDAGTVVGKIESSGVVLKESPTGVAIKPAAKGAAARIMPAVRALAQKLNVDISTLQGTGPQGSITAQDVQNAATTTHTAAPAPAGAVPLQGVRRVMAQAMAKSHAEVVPVTLSEDADLYQWSEKTDFTVRLLQAIVQACKAEPALNAHFYSQPPSRLLCPHVNIGVAVDTPEGLYVPVISNADTLSPEDLRAQLNAMKQKAQKHAFAPEDFHNATFVLSNFGTLTGKYASPIVVPPTVAILGVGKSRQTVVPHYGEPAVHPILPLCLTFDHRAVTGGEAARFLATLVSEIEKA